MECSFDKEFLFRNGGTLLFRSWNTLFYWIQGFEEGNFDGGKELFIIIQEDESINFR